MDDGYLIGSKEVIFEVLAVFAEGIQQDHGCTLNMRKCKMYSLTKGVCEEARREGYIPKEVEHVDDGTYVDESGEIL